MSEHRENPQRKQGLYGHSNGGVYDWIRILLKDESFIYID